MPFTSNFNSSCNSIFKNDKKIKWGKNQNDTIWFKEKWLTFATLPNFPKSKLENLGEVSFASNFESSRNLRFKNTKNESRQNLKGYAWFKKKNRQFRRFPIFRLEPMPKIGNSEISGSILLLQIFTTQDLKTKKMIWNKI